MKYGVKRDGAYWRIKIDGEISFDHRFSSEADAQCFADYLNECESKRR